MTAFAIRDGDCGAGPASYEAGLITLPDGTPRGVESVARLSVREGAPPAPALLGVLRGALGRAGALPIPLRVAASTLRAGLGIIEEGIAPEDEGVTVEIAFDDGAAILARMPSGLASVIRRDGEVARGALARAAAMNPGATRDAATGLPAEAGSPDADKDGLRARDGRPDAVPSAEALTTLFRYEKRNGRLRRVAASDSKL